MTKTIYNLVLKLHYDKEHANKNSWQAIFLIKNRLNRTLYRFFLLSLVILSFIITHILKYATVFSVKTFFF